MSGVATGGFPKATIIRACAGNPDDRSRARLPEIGIQRVGIEICSNVSAGRQLASKGTGWNEVRHSVSCDSNELPWGVEFSILHQANLSPRWAEQSGSSSVAERQLPKLNVAGSIPVSRSNLIKNLEQRNRKSRVDFGAVLGQFFILIYVFGVPEAIS